MIRSGDKVVHNQYGAGIVISVNGGTAQVRFNQYGELDVPTSALSTPLFS